MSKTLTVSELAERWGVHHSVIYKRISRGEIVATVPAGRKYGLTVSMSEVKRYERSTGRSTGR